MRTTRKGDRTQHQIEKGMQAVNMKRDQMLDLYFLDARHKLIELAAFLDRLETAEDDSSFRLDAFRDALAELADTKPDKAKRVLMAFSDPTCEPIPAATVKAACGAWSGRKPAAAREA
jgi:hypothetical protein